MGIVITVPGIHSPDWPSPLLDCLEGQEIQVPALWEVPLPPSPPIVELGGGGLENTTRVLRGRDGETIRVCSFHWGIWDNVMSSSIV